jgi:hypothetical protein
LIIVRYADDLAVGFEHEADARRFLDMMRARLTEFDGGNRGGGSGGYRGRNRW